VVSISDIGKDLDKYIASRREKSEWSFFSKSKPRQEREETPVPEDLKTDSVHVIANDEEPGFWTRLFNKEKEPVSEDLSPEEMVRLEAMQTELKHIDEQEREHPEQMEVLEEQRESLLDKFFGLFRGYEHRHKMEHEVETLAVREEEAEARLDEEVIDVLKSIHKWLNKLPKRHRDEFKKSNDFQAYKKLLEKYGLAKSGKKDAKTEIIE
jgi:hypothetical protein